MIGGSKVLVKEVEVQTSEVPFLSVSMTAYNHEHFIREAVEGVMMQVTDFPIELVVGEDCSQDKTRSILLELQQKYPARIRLLLPDQNLGPHENFRNVIKACRGKYIAFTDGDDFWNDPQKLAKQVRLLEADPEVRICFHPVAVVDEKSRPLNQFHPPQEHRKPKVTLSGLLHSISCHAGIPTGSVVMRRSVVPDMPRHFDKLVIGDWPVWVIALRTGAIACIDEPMTCYRFHGGGAWSGRDPDKQMEAEIAFWKAIRTYIPKPLRDIGWRRLRECCEKWFAMTPDAPRMRLVKRAFDWLVASLVLRQWSGAQFRYFVGRIFPGILKAFGK